MTTKRGERHFDCCRLGGVSGPCRSTAGAEGRIAPGVGKKDGAPRGTPSLHQFSSSRKLANCDHSVQKFGIRFDENTCLQASA